MGYLFTWVELFQHLVGLVLNRFVVIMHSRPVNKNAVDRILNSCDKVTVGLQKINQTKQNDWEKHSKTQMVTRTLKDLETITGRNGTVQGPTGNECSACVRIIWNAIRHNGSRSITMDHGPFTVRNEMMEKPWNKAHAAAEAPGRAHLVIDDKRWLNAIN